MMPKNSNNRIDPDLPVSLFAEVRPDGIIDSLYVDRVESPEDHFISFAKRLSTRKKECGDNWIFWYELPQGSILPAAGATCDFRLFHNKAQREGIFPTRVLSLLDSTYCVEHDIDVLSAAGRHDRLLNEPEYRSFLTTHGIFKGSQSLKDRTDNLQRTVRAVEAGAGVFLYDLTTPLGREAYKSFMQHCGAHFFGKEMTGTDSLCLYDVHCFFDRKSYMSRIGAINFNFNCLGRDVSLSDLKSDLLFPRKMIREGLLVREYDMRPQSMQFAQFVNGENISIPIYSHSLDIALLDQIAREGLPLLRPSAELRTFSPYIGRFRDLQDRIVDCDADEDATTLQLMAKSRARDILDEEFPNRRRVPAPDLEQNLEIIPSRGMDERTFRSGHRL